MSKMWNLTADQWAQVLGSSDNPARIAESLATGGPTVPWSQVLVDATSECSTTLDLGSGRGEHSAVLSRAGRRPTLVDWSADNLEFSRRMFGALDLPGEFCRADITAPLPFASRSIDAVFSCGVFEYFTAEQIDRILAEMFRVARRRVIVMVPNAWSVAYRLGKWYMERTGAWVWGGEVPSYTLRPAFERAGGRRVREFSVAPAHALGFLTMPGGGRAQRALRRITGPDVPGRPARFRQGYLLVTIADAHGGPER